MPDYDHLIYNGMTVAWKHVVGGVKLLVDGADWWAFYLVTLSGTLLVVYQVCAAELDILFSSRGDTCIFPEWVNYVFLDDAFLDQFLVYCVALCGLMVQTISKFETFFNLDYFVLVVHVWFYSIEIWENGEHVYWRPWLTGVKSIWYANWGRVFHLCRPENGWVGMGVSVECGYHGHFNFAQSILLWL